MHALSPLLTDLYQLTMSYGYWKAGRANDEAVFHLFYRKNPFKGHFSIVAGLAQVIDLIENFHFTPSDCAYLSSLKGGDNQPLFEEGFITFLSQLPNDLSVYAMPEGTIAFAHAPLIRIQGNIVLCQLLETPLLNIVNFQTLIATKAARVCKAADSDPVSEFGLRRAQGPDGALSASRAAYIGGCSSTSNVLAGKTLGIPVRGTHAHSWVMSFESEIAAFEAYAAAMPNNCIFLVDTYDTISGVQNAIEVSISLRQKGHQPIGIRLDSGDLATLSKTARKMLDDAGFEDMKIVASNDLDEYSIAELKVQGAKIDIWGVGTKLVTAYDQPALGGVYKLAAIRQVGGAWNYKMKLSEQPIKVSNPGILQVRRFFNAQKQWVGDMIYSETFEKTLPKATLLENEALIEWENCTYQDLLVPIFEKGKKCYQNPDIHSIRAFCRQQLLHLPSPEPPYPVGLEIQLSDHKRALMSLLKGDASFEIFLDEMHMHTQSQTVEGVIHLEGVKNYAALQIQLSIYQCYTNAEGEGIKNCIGQKILTTHPQANIHKQAVSMSYTIPYPHKKYNPLIPKRILEAEEQIFQLGATYVLVVKAGALEVSKVL